MGKCNFNPQWLNTTDANGFKVSDWGRNNGSEGEMFCNICQKAVNIECGHGAVQQHAAGANHKKLCSTILATSQKRLQPNSSSNVTCFNPRDAAAKAEILWVIKMVNEDWSFSSATDGIKDLFSVMFGEIPKGFSLSNTKAHYIVTDALGPYFKKKHAGRFRYPVLRIRLR